MNLGGLVFMMVVLVWWVNSVRSNPFLLAVCLVPPLSTSTFAFRSPMMIMWFSCCSWLTWVVSSSNWFSIASLGVVSCLPYMVAIAIFVELFNLIHNISVSVPSVVSIISTLSLMPL